MVRFLTSHVPVATQIPESWFLVCIGEQKNILLKTMGEGGDCFGFSKQCASVFQIVKEKQHMSLFLDFTFQKSDPKTLLLVTENGPHSEANLGYHLVITCSSPIEPALVDLPRR